MNSHLSAPEDAPRPLTREELVQWLDNITKMHDFGLACEYGSEAHRLYHEGMPKCAEFIRECVKLTPVIGAPTAADGTTPSPTARSKEELLLIGLMDLGADTVKKITALVIEQTLNNIVKADIEAVGALIEMRIFCKDRVETESPAVPYREKDGAPLQLGVLGVLNAIAALHGLVITANYGDKDKDFRGFSVKLKGPDDGGREK